MKPFTSAAICTIAESARNYHFRDAEIQHCVTNALNFSMAQSEVDGVAALAAVNLVWQRRLGKITPPQE